MKDHDPYAAPSESVAQPRSVVPTVFGILNLIFAAFVVISLIGTIFMVLAPDQIPEMDVEGNSAAEIVFENPAYKKFMLLMMPLTAVSFLLLVTSGVGLLMYRKWGRSLSMGYIVLAVIGTVAGLVGNYIYLFKPLMEQANAPGAKPQEIGGAIGGAIGGLFGGCFGLIYPVLLLIFLNRKNVKVALGVGAPEDQLYAEADTSNPYADRF